MDGAKAVDKISMSLDDIIKLDKKSNKPKFVRKTNIVAKNSLNKARKTIANKKPITVSFNQNRLGISGKRNVIKNILVNDKRNVNKPISQNRSINVIPQTVRANRLSLNKLPDIRITRTNDQQKPFNQSRTFNNNPNNFKERKPYRENYNQGNNNFRSNRDGYQASRQFEEPRMSRQPNIYRSLNNNNFSRPQETDYRKHSSQNYDYNRPANRSFNDRNEPYRPRNDRQERRNSSNLEEVEYGVMARALIAAHKESRHPNDRSERSRGNFYRR